ncbi:MAG: hypothetical protein RIF36_15710 [Imperialibacter sp.]|uniref:hypothetical protein n=1 Tax=Imperialibacter sp. TaxID=2038411 RepID=UPI0032EBB9B0
MRTCPVCRGAVKGRVDKIYCSVQCKSVDQYEKKLKSEKFYFQVDKQLKINRKILKKYNVSGLTTIRREALHNEGFNPHFFTHIWKNDKGDVYFFCYDVGFLGITHNNKQKYLLVTWQEYMGEKLALNT